jgi:Family of unknown function (DUF5719)
MIRLLRFVLFASLSTILVLILPNTVLLSTQKQSSAVYPVKAKDLQLVCNGPMILAGGKTGTSVTSFRRLKTVGVSIGYSAAPETTLRIFGKSSVVGYSVRQDLSASLDKSGSVTVIDSTGATAQGSALLTASQLQLATDKQISGLLGAPCLRPQSEFWFVGGSTKIGREALLVINNPSPVDSTVDLEIYTENGNSHAAGLTGISAPSGKTTLLPLSSFVPQSGSIALHLTSHGGSLTALVQQKTVRGISANGADFIAPSELQAKTAVFPGILIRGATHSAKLRSMNSKFSDVQNILRVYVPGDADANLTLQVLGTDSNTFGTVLSVTAPAGKASDFKIAGLKDGNYFGFMQSNVETRSSIRLVRSNTSGDAYTDFAWLNATEPFTNPRYVTVSKAGISKLSLVNPSNKQTKVTLKFGSETLNVNIPALSEKVIATRAGLAVGIFPSDAAIHANLLVDVKGRIAVIPVLDQKNISGEVKVSVH